MQLAERRDDPKRIDVARPLAIVGADGAAVEGYTRNLSATGLRARFDGHCSVGANLLVRIELEEGAPPVEQRARVVWSAPDVYGGGMDVGLRLLAGADRQATEAAPAPDRAPLLTAGARVEVEYGGIALPAIVARVGEMSDSGVVQVTLRMVEDACPIGDGEIVVEKAPIVERSLHYAAEARRLWLLHGLPVARRAAAAVVVVARLAWARTPARFRLRIDRAGGAVRAFVQRLASTVSHRFRVSRQAP